jgi:hypothetical protein
MMVSTTIALLAITIIGCLKGEADTLQHSATYRNDTWKNKWKTVDNLVQLDGNKHHWWYMYGRLYETEYNQREKFIFSSTLLVWRVDKWHRLNFISNRLIDVGVAVLLNNAWLILILAVVRSIGFYTTYRK